MIEGEIPDSIIPSRLLESAIAFTKWLIGQTKLIYADARGITFKESVKVVRFMERFKSKGWITARSMIHWHSSARKPNATEARAFMQKVVTLGYAIANGETGKHYQILIKDSPSNTGNNQPHPPAMASRLEIK